MHDRSNPKQSADVLTGRMNIGDPRLFQVLSMRRRQHLAARSFPSVYAGCQHVSTFLPGNRGTDAGAT
jgi:hypothetical protein